MGQILLWAFVAYLLYNFIFKFVIPLVRVTRQVKRQVRDFKQQTGGGFGPGAFQGGFTNGGFSEYNSNRSSNNNGQTQTIFTPSQEPAKKPETTSAKKDDYIDFEEIK
ncbi:MAG: DUF4834 family protein [Flavitalea sp.]